LQEPRLSWPSSSSSSDPSSLFTVLLIDVDIVGEHPNFVHWLVHNVPSDGDVSKGDVSLAYVPPFFFALRDAPNGDNGTKELDEETMDTHR
jgi:phosphatidylethanolamine-binding protein (PEBP) family uncharacterized protein